MKRQSPFNFNSHPINLKYRHFNLNSRCLNLNSYCFNFKENGVVYHAVMLGCAVERLNIPRWKTNEISLTHTFTRHTFTRR